MSHQLSTLSWKDSTLSPKDTTLSSRDMTLSSKATTCNTLPHTATHCNTLLYLRKIRLYHREVLLDIVMWMGSRILNGQSSDLFSNEPFEKRPVMTTGLRRCIGCLIFIGLFLQNSLIIGGSIAKRDLQLKASYASSPPCIQDSDFHCNDHFETHLFGNAF